MKVYLGASSIISPLGFGTPSNFEALVQDRIALKKHKFDFSDSDFFCSVIEESELGKDASLTHFEKMLVLVIDDVITQSSLDLSNEKTLLIISTTKGNVDLLE